MLHELDGPPVVDPARSITEAYAEVTTAYIEDREIEDWAARTLAGHSLLRTDSAFPARWVERDLTDSAFPQVAKGQRYSTRDLLDSIAKVGKGADSTTTATKNTSLGLDMLATWAIRRRERVVLHRGRHLTRRNGGWFLLDPVWDAITEDLDVDNLTLRRDVVGDDVVWKATIGDTGTVDGERFTEDYWGSGASPAEALAYALGALFAPSEPG